MNLFVALAFIILGILIFLGKGGFLLPGVKEMLEKYNININFKKVGYVVATMLIFMGISLLSDYFDILDKLPMWLVYSVVVVVIIVVVGVLFTGKRKK